MVEPEHPEGVCMANRFQGRVPPFDVAAGYHPFMDHRFVHAGQPRWGGADGAPIHYWDQVDLDQIREAHESVPRGIELRAQPAERSEPILTCTEPWEYMMGGPQIIRDGGMYRAWYHVIPPDHWDPDLAPSIGWGPDWGGFLCYAESDDGFVWRKPALGRYTWQGHDDTNIVLGRELVGQSGLHGQSIFVDPQAPDHERFKAIYMGKVTEDVIRKWMRAHPDRVDPWSSMHPDRAILVATSPDGIGWTPHPDPVVIYISDTQNVVDWNPQRQSYVWYSRGWSWDRRTIARAESPDFFDWPLPESVLTMPPENLAMTDIYTNGKVTYPGDPTTHIMFPTLYDRALDTTTVAVATSSDDIAWDWVPGGPVLKPGIDGAFDSGCVFACKGLVDLPGAQVGMAYTGYNLPHKYPREQLQSGSALALWPRGRIAGLAADGDGEFSTPPLLLHGRELRLNLQTAGDGEVRVTALERAPGWTSRPGHGALDSLGASQPMQGDHLSVPVCWNGEPTLRVSTHGPVVLRFQLRRATVFGFELVE